MFKMDSSAVTHDLQLRNRFTLKSISLVNGLSLLATFAISYRFYFGPRTYPLVPILAFPFWSSEISSVLFIITILSLISSLVFTGSGLPWKIFAVSVAGMFVLDQSRIQPYHCIFFIIGLALMLGKTEGDNRAQERLSTIRLLLCCMYFWAGFHKLGKPYILGVFPFVFDPILKHAPKFFHTPSLLFTFGLGSALVELLIGVGLATRRFQKIAAYGAICLHLGILLLIGPLGLNIAPVVWPWNLALIAFVYLLFIQPKVTSAKEILIPKNKFHLLVLLLFGFAPLLNLVNLWDAYLSFHAFSGSTMDAYIQFTPQNRTKLPPEIRSVLREDRLHFYLWSMNGYNMSAYPSQRTYQSITHQVCDQYSLDPTTAHLVIRSAPQWPSGNVHCRVYDCDGNRQAITSGNGCPQ